MLAVEEMVLNENKMLRDEGRKIGISEGKKIGISEGRKIGISEGKKIGISEGRKIGISEGKKIGISEGKKIGISEGKLIGIDEGINRVAKEMLKNGVDDKYVEKYTHLSREKIEKLKTEILKI